MTATASKIDMSSVTFRAGHKARCIEVADPAFVNMVRGNGKLIEGKGHFPPGVTAGVDRLQAIYSLPTNAVLEIYLLPDGNEKAWLYLSLDIWLNFSNCRDMRRVVPPPGN